MVQVEVVVQQLVEVAVRVQEVEAVPRLTRYRVVFVLRLEYFQSQQEADASSDVITGMISVYDHDAYALVDPGATHSFISVPFTERHQIESRPIDGRMVVSVPNGNTMISERIVPGSRLVIQNKDFPTYLIVLGIHDFDIVLGMDLLS